MAINAEQEPEQTALPKNEIKKEEF